MTTALLERRSADDGDVRTNLSKPVPVAGKARLDRLQTYWAARLPKVLFAPVKASGHIQTPCRVLAARQRACAMT